MLSHANIMANALNILPGTASDEDTRYLHAAPMFHLADGAMTFWSPASAARISSCRASIPPRDAS